MRGDAQRVGVEESIFAFQPCAQRAELVETRVRASLASSLDAALSALTGSASLPQSDIVDRVRLGSVAPVVFGAYTELVEAIVADDIKKALEIACELSAPNFGRVNDLQILTLHDSHLGKGQTARYRRLVDEDQQLGASLLHLSRPNLAAASGRVSEAFALLEVAAPESMGEIRALVREIVLVNTPGNRPFGACSFQLWGCLFLKLKRDATRVDIIESVVHECAHALLFGFGMGQPLVTNEPDELYPSPLRRDPRPMDGVVHATYVIARMHCAMQILLASKLLSGEEVRQARLARERHACAYANGLQVIEGNAKWTRAGEAALLSARAYMHAQTEH
jgi:hypothetical protein